MSGAYDATIASACCRLMYIERQPSPEVAVKFAFRVAGTVLVHVRWPPFASLRRVAHQDNFRALLLVAGCAEDIEFSRFAPLLRMS